MSTAVVPKPKKKKATNRVVFWSAECKYVVILDRVNELEWKLVDDDKQLSKCNLLWIDVATIHERIHGIKFWQCINHFPGMPNIARKNRMGQNLNRMLKIFPKEYSFYPRTWILPGELADFRTNFDSNGNSIGNKIYIIKPDAGCQGRGIFLTRTWDNVPMMENVVAQLYIKKPLLIDGFKFDLRLYCFVSSVKPLRMYLFHDGLVRMCTEEYVKPTKQNINNVCMHLTNYAVNKHNENFQQPSAKSSEENQDGGSKRSLHWFMNTVRKDKGDAKADWLWKRMGTLCTRTVMSILPTLSREYESKFKDFRDIPVDISKIVSANGYAAAAGDKSGATSASPTTAAGIAATGAGSAKNGNGSSGIAAGGAGKPAVGLSAKLKSATAANKDADSTAGAGSEDERASPADALLDDKKAGEGAAASGTTNGETSEVPDGMPKIRGSRCFEILGFDIMLDSNLKPWLIEVNHLPSFGTDSLLDKDIKERLMEQVFSVLPVMADDERAAAAYHKVESEKRLIAQRAHLKAEEEAKHKRPVAPARKKESMLPQVRDSSEGSGGGGDPQPQPSLFNNSGEGTSNRSPTPPSDPAPSSTAAATAAGAEGEQPPQQPPAEIEDEECTPERLEEIKKILMEVYKKFSPEKTGKIDRLLAKYFGHEEEFLRFVFAKYEVDATQYDPRKRKVVPTPVVVPVETVQPDAKERAASLTPKGRSSNNNREVSKRYSRSLSPPRSGSMASGSAKNKSSNWKSTTDEDAAFRAEVLAAHIPDENDEWMQYELSKLVQFTRIFPPVSNGKDGNDHDGNEEEDDDGNDDDDNGNIATAAASTTATAAGATATGSSGAEKENGQDHSKDKTTAKVTPIEEILFQIFVQDKRQTMRLRCPLPSRVKMDDNSSSFLPEIESKSSRNNSISSSQSSKGVGWKAPPKPATKEPPKQPTEAQLAAAQRLSQGLTVNSSRSARMRNSNLGANGYSLVLDANADYSSNPMDANYREPHQQETSAFTLGMSTKASRLLEERNMNKIRLEQAKANQAAVLRQQVFHFDPNYDPFAGINAQGIPMGGGGGGIGGNSIMGGGGMGYSDNASVMGGGSVVGGGSVSMMDARPVPPNMMGGGYRAANGRSNSYNAGEAAAAAASYQTQQQQQQQMQQHAMNGGTQEELLKQLFPSWF